MTTDEFNRDLQKKIDAIVKEDKPLIIAVKSVSALQSKRIFIDAKNRTGGNIGEYKNREYYISPSKSPKSFQTKGKSGKTKKKNGEPYKTGYFANFLDYKKEIGRNKNSNSVDLLLSGELNRGWSNGLVRKTAHNYVITLSDFNYDKVERYDVNDVFGLSKYEKDTMIKVLNAELLKALI
jgi:hypothetical protein